MNLTPHYFFEVAAMSTGLWLYYRSPVRDLVGEKNRIYLVLAAGIGALIGSRLISALSFPELFLNPPSLLFYYANKTIIGAIAGGILGYEIAKRYFGIKVWTGDRTLIPLLVAIAIGRVGCFLTGVTDGTVGGPCDFFWCLEQGDGITRHPNSLYEIGFLLTFLASYITLKTREQTKEWWVFRTPGAAFRVFIVSYFSFRFYIESLKEMQPLVLGLDSIQIVCLLFAAYYTYELFRAYRTRQTY